MSVMDEDDLTGRYPAPDQLLLDPAIDRKSSHALGLWRAEVREDHLRTARNGKGNTFLSVIDCVGRAVVNVLHAVDHHVELAPVMGRQAGHDKTQIDRGMTAVSNDR